MVSGRHFDILSLLTALLCVHNDIVHAIGDKKYVILVLLDISAAFDTVDHTVPLWHYWHSSEMVRFIGPYLTHRTQTIKISDSFSTKHKLSFGVPQGLVLGPALFSLCSSHVAKIARKYGLFRSICIQIVFPTLNLVWSYIVENILKRYKFTLIFLTFLL